MIGRKPLTSINVEEAEEQINILMTETDLIHTIGVSKMIDSLLNNIIKFRYIFYILLILCKHTRENEWEISIKIHILYAYSIRSKKCLSP